MYAKQVLLGTAAYTVATFGLAVGWHIGLFEAFYQAVGYFEGEPSFSLGFITILLQGLIISALYPRLSFSRAPIIKGLKVSLIWGVYLWSSHVLGFVAKQNLQNAQTFVFMETAYLLVQFVVFGVLIGWIYRKK